MTDTTTHQDKLAELDDLVQHGIAVPLMDHQTARDYADMERRQNALRARGDADRKADEDRERAIGKQDTAKREVREQLKNASAEVVDLYQSGVSIINGLVSAVLDYQKTVLAAGDRYRVAGVISKTDRPGDNPQGLDADNHATYSIGDSGRPLRVTSKGETHTVLQPEQVVLSLIRDALDKHDGMRPSVRQYPIGFREELRSVRRPQLPGLSDD